MTGLEIFLITGTWVTAVVALGGVVNQTRKNGKSQSARDQQITDNQGAILGRLNDDKTGLTALNEKMHNFDKTCASTRAGFSERIIAAERDIKELKQKEYGA